MREYKFRGKSIQSFGNSDIGSWFYGGIIINPYGDELHIAYFDKSMLSWRNVPVDPATVGQYTGLSDKNGKEIYEGDIVGFMDAETCSNENGYDFEEFYNYGYVAYDAESLRFYFTNRSSVEMDDILSDDIEVAGNRFDNPELLEG